MRRKGLYYLGWGLVIGSIVFAFKFFPWNLPTGIIGCALILFNNDEN